MCILHESEDHTGTVKEVFQSAQSANSDLSVVTAVVAVAAHPRAAPPTSVQPLLSKCPAGADPKCP
jgi:hypothetical protein